MKKIYLLIFAVIIIVGGYFWLFGRQFKFPKLKQAPMVSPSPGSKIKITKGIKHTIPLEEIFAGGPPKDGIPSIDKPKFISITEATKIIKDDGLGIAVTYKNTNRFYPFQILVWHEIANDKIDDLPLLVTYCPLCLTGIVYERKIKGQEVTFGVSGKLFNNNLLMYDRKNDNLWYQINGEVVVGDFAGEEKLKIYPSDLMLFKDWRMLNPQGQVLSTETGFVRNYQRDPYGDYYTSRSVFFPVSKKDERIHPKDWVVGILIDNKAKAYKVEKIRKVKIFNDELAGKKLLIVAVPETGAVRIFERALDKKDLTFEIKEGKITDKQTSSIWDFNGLAASGPLKGKKLNLMDFVNAFWFSWAAYYQETEVLK